MAYGLCVVLGFRLRYFGCYFNCVWDFDSRILSFLLGRCLALLIFVLVCFGCFDAGVCRWTSGSLYALGLYLGFCDRLREF